MGIAPHDDLSGRRPVRRAQPEAGSLFRIGNQCHRRVPPSNQIGRGWGVGSVGDDDLYRTLVVLRQHRVDRRPDGRLGVPNRDENRHRRQGNGGGAKMPRVRGQFPLGPNRGKETDSPAQMHGCEGQREQERGVRTATDADRQRAERQGEDIRERHCRYRPGGAGHGQDRRGGQSQQQQRAGEMPGQQGGRMSSRHDPLPSAVVEILPSEAAQGAAGPVGDHEPGIEPHRFPARPQPPVEFVVLGPPKGRVDAAHRLQRIAPERAQEDGVDGPLRAAQSVAGAASPQGSGHRHRHRAPEERGADRPLLAADIGRPRPLQRAHRAAHVSGWEHRMGVAPQDDLSGRRPVRRVDSGRDDLFRIGNQCHRRVPPPNQIGSGWGVGSVGDDDLYRTLVVLGRYRVDRRPDGRLGIPNRDENRHRRPGSRSGRVRDENRALLHVP